MPSATERRYAISFIAPVVTTDEYNEPVEDWDEPTTLATVRARVRFGSSQEQRQAAQESASQTATFECVRSATLDAVTVKDRIQYDGSDWDITERAPLDRATIRFTGVRLA
jgi:SPP1 family predicted phage head-tail adaptor